MPKESFINVQNTRIPLRVKKEWRKTVRYSISKKSINLTVPSFYNRFQIADEYQKLNQWAQKQFLKSPQMIERFKIREYNDQDYFKIFGKVFILNIKIEKRKTFSAEIINKKILIKAPEHQDEQIRHKEIGLLLSRLFSKHFLAEIETRVQYFNKLYFKEKINSIRLKNNQSNWGSCSSNRNINLSSRLLFAPQYIIDYVIVHELAHLKEMNHSDRFWSVVKNAMPDYKERDAWLTKYGNQFKF